MHRRDKGGSDGQGSADAWTSSDEEADSPTQAGASSRPRLGLASSPSHIGAAEGKGEGSGDGASTQQAHTCRVTTVRWQSNGRRLLSGDEHGNIVLWDTSNADALSMATGSPLPTVLLMWQAHRSIVTTAAFVPSAWQPHNRLVKAGITARQTARLTRTNEVQ